MSQINNDDAAKADAQTAPSIPIWNTYLDSLRDLAPKMLNKLPHEMRTDPQIQMEVVRLMFSAVASTSLEAIGGNGDHPVFLPSLNEVITTFQPNADTLYKKAQITPGGSYRLRGRAGSLRIAKIGAMSPPTPSGEIRATAYFDLNTLNVDKDGNFDVLLSPAKPANYNGDWWQLDPHANTVLLRQVAYDWSSEQDPVISIERVDGPVTRPRPSATELEQRYQQLIGTTAYSALLLIDHTVQLQREGFVNKFKIWDVVATHGGLFGQFYYECVYDLKDDEALLIEVDYPKKCEYASLLLANPVFETIDWVNNHSSLNGAQWHVTADGKLWVVVSAQDPCIQNWLDTAGYPLGVVQGRWTECDSTPLPNARVVKLAEVAKLVPADLPSITAEQRDRIVRDRRAHYQQRVHW